MFVSEKALVVNDDLKYSENRKGWSKYKREVEHDVQ
jgi:hypothetical protein